MQARLKNIWTYLVRSERYMSILGKYENILTDLSDSLGVSFFIKDMKHALYMKIRNPIQTQIKFIVDLNEWNKDGSNILNALREIRNSALRTDAKDSFNERAAEKIIISLENGKTVSEGMKLNFNDEIISLFEIGEATNTVDILTQEYIANEQSMKAVSKGVSGKIVHPLTLLTVVITLMVSIHNIGVPMLLGMGLHIEKLTGDAQTLLEYSEIIASIWPLLSWFMLSTWLLYVFTKNSYAGTSNYLPSRNWLDKLPHYSIHKRLTAMKLIKQISMLSRAGLSLTNTVSILMKSATAYERYYLNKMDVLIRNETGTIAKYLDVGLLGDDLFQRLASLAKQEGEQSKMNAIYVAGERSGDAAQAEIKKTMRYILPVVWLLMIGLTLILILGIISFNGNVKNLI